jgi:hypothetical protein
MTPVTPFLVGTITVVAALVALLGVLSTLARRRIGLVHLAAAALAGGHRPEETATFVSYLIGVVLVPVAGVLWARAERTRWAGTVLAVAGVVVGVMTWRLLQLWEATGA